MGFYYYKSLVRISGHIGGPMKYAFLALALMLSLSGCGHKKLVAKSCEKAGNADIFVCDPL